METDRPAESRKTVDRRSLVALSSGGLLYGLMPREARALTGIHPALEKDVKAGDAIIAGLPKHDYVAVMRALADLDKTAPWSVAHRPNNKREPFNRRWVYYWNPLLVRIWKEMGYDKPNDCDSFCGVTLGWALKRDGRRPPPDCASSQNYKTYGTPVTAPQLGDLAIYTHRADPGKGHVGIFMAHNSDGTFQILGANQLMSTDTTCGPGFPANVVDDRKMTSSKTAELFFNRFVRPPKA